MILSSLPLGIVHFMAYPQTMRGEGSVIETLQTLAADPDFSLIELTHIADKRARSEIKTILKGNSKRCAYGAQPCLLLKKQNLNDADNSKRQAAVDTLKQAIDEAAEIGAEAFAFLSGKDPGAGKRSSATELLKKSVLEVCLYAKATRPELKIIMESFDRKPFGKNALIGPTDEAVAFIKSVRTDFPGFSLMLDLSHLPLLGEKPEYSLAVARDVLGHAHIGNCVMRDSNHPAYGDEHPRFGIAAGENGAPELAEFLKALEKIGYLNVNLSNAVSFEVKPLPGESSAEVIANAKETLRQAWGLLGWPEN